MSEMTPTEPTDDVIEPTDDAIEPTASTAVIKDQKDPKNSTDSHVAGHGEHD